MAALHLDHLELHNESNSHAGPATDSHFKAVIVSEDFAALSPVKRHQMVYRILAAELAGPVHALALHTYTQQEWQATGQAIPASPACRGGS
ncbi:MAG: BolA/IbaG family iron-sulfur metabolism protein, partial [Pseudomonadales bacterium]|nr:BolA/IbaG family iron-sulfur metabolism protein [Pseudomonadales bacterium]